MFFREILNSMNLLMYMAPVAVVLLLPATLFMEENVVGITLALARDDIWIIWYLLFNSALAYFVNLTNFLVTKHTSALTLQVCPPFFSMLYVIISRLCGTNVCAIGFLYISFLLSLRFVLGKGHKFYSLNGYSTAYYSDARWNCCKMVVLKARYVWSPKNVR